MLLLKLILLFLLIKAVWIVLVAGFWAVIIFLIVTRSLRDRVSRRDQPF